MTELEQLKANAEAAATALEAASASYIECRNEYVLALANMNAARNAIAQYEENQNGGE